MPTEHQKLTHQLRIRFALPPGRPTDEELDAIVRDVNSLALRQGRVATDDEWRAITLRHVRFEGTYIYKGLTFQDLNALLAAIRAQTQSAQGARK